MPRRATIKRQLRAIDGLAFQIPFAAAVGDANIGGAYRPALKPAARR
jgi:hypothetical protein